jgi:Zn-dependent membrane protease YugP
MMMGFDPLYFLFALPGLALALFASLFVRSRFAHYSKIPSARGLSGAEAAQIMLSRAGVREVSIEMTHGFLSDHYDPTSRTLRLSPDVYSSTSLAAIGVACHEAGHALQHAKGYALLGLRSALVPATNIGSTLSYVVIMIGFLLQRPQFILMGALLFSLVVLFALVTLPVEWDASARAKVSMVQAGVVTLAEADDAAKVLNAAFMTYVAAAVSALLTLLYYLIRAGVFRRDD